MIKYNLICKDGHEFEGWFQNSEAFDKLADAKQLSCTVCGTSKVSKALMAPNLGAAVKSKSDTPDTKPSETQEMTELQQEFRKAVKKVREHIEQNADYVGKGFAEEARKIHYEEAEARDIYGEATSTEVKELVEEGVEFQALPTLPEEQN